MMLQLIKKDLLIMPIYLYIIFIGCMLLLYFSGLPASFVLIIFYLPIIIVPFILDRMSNTHHYLLSLPVRKQHIVLARYLFSFITVCISLSFLWFFIWILSFTVLVLAISNDSSISMLFS